MKNNNYIRHAPHLRMTKKNLSLAVDISGTIYHMLVIYGTLV